MVRVTLQALAAVLGGTQSLHTNSRDEALALPTEDSVRVALRTQQILAHEAGVAGSVDPLAGSYLIESLTDPGWTSTASSLVVDLPAVSPPPQAASASRESDARRVRVMRRS